MKFLMEVLNEPQMDLEQSLSKNAVNTWKPTHTPKIFSEKKIKPLQINPIQKRTFSNRGKTKGFQQVSSIVFAV